MDPAKHPPAHAQTVPCNPDKQQEHWGEAMPLSQGTACYQDTHSTLEQGFRRLHVQTK